MVHDSNQVLMLSIRLSPVGIAHLLKVGSAQAIVVSKRTQNSAKQALLHISNEQIHQIISIPYESLPELRKSGNTDIVERPTPISDRTVALILHSSGTTGLPKPIRLAHRYFFSYAACHHLQPEECNNRLNVSTLPMYHVRLKGYSNHYWF
jgi:long-subunit acyl-CoA synthetase (AMP-forming)